MCGIYSGICRIPDAPNQMLHLTGTAIVVSRNTKLLQKPQRRAWSFGNWSQMAIH